MALVCVNVGVERTAPAQSLESTSASTSAIEEALAVAGPLIAAGEPIAAFAVLMHAMESLPEGADDAPLRFGIAQALMAGGRHAQAEQVLARLAEERPENRRIRLDRGRALFALGWDDEAREVFLDVHRDPDLPTVTRRKVEEFLFLILARQRWRFDLDLGLWYDNNVNNAIELETVEIPALGGRRFRVNERPLGAWVGRTGLRVRWREPVTERGRVFIETNAAATRNTAIGASAHNRTWANLSVGPRIGYAVPIAGRRRPGQFRADVGLERRWRGGSAFATGVWGRLGLDQILNGDWRVGVFPRFWVTRYDGQGDDVNPTGGSLLASVARRAGPGWLTVSGTLARETPARRNLRWRSQGLRLQYAATVGENWSGWLWAGWTRTRFDAEDPTFVRRRDDRMQTVGLTLSHRKISWEGYLPALILQWSRTDSNIPLYDREVRTVRVGLNRLF